MNELPVNQQEGTVQEFVTPSSLDALRALFGSFDENIGLIESELGVRVH